MVKIGGIIIEITWKSITGHEGYFVSDCGLVGSQRVNRGRHGLKKMDEIKILKCSKHKVKNKFYKSVFLGGRKGERIMVHRLIYRTFYGDIPEGKIVRHLNDDSLDNRLVNLAVGTQKDNMEDCKRNGGFKNRKKLDARQIVEIRKMKNEKPSTPNRIIAEKFNVSRRTIDRILKQEYERENRRKII